MGNALRGPTTESPAGGLAHGADEDHGDDRCPFTCPSAVGPSAAGIAPLTGGRLRLIMLTSALHYIREAVGWKPEWLVGAALKDPLWQVGRAINLGPGSTAGIYASYSVHLHEAVRGCVTPNSVVRAVTRVFIMDHRRLELTVRSHLKTRDQRAMMRMPVACDEGALLRSLLVLDALGGMARDV